MKNKQLVLIPSADGITRTERFRSLCACVELTVKGKAEANASVVYSLLGYTEGGKELVIYEKTLPVNGDGAFGYVHEFDPVSLAVYQNAVEFCARVKCEGSHGFHILLSENEQVATASQSLRKARKKCGPKKISNVLFIGNSILLGMELQYGMCASSPKNDYAYHVTQALLAANPDCRFEKVYGSMLEHAECMEDFEEVFYREPNKKTGKPIVESLTEELDLIILQMTDNVNTEKKTETFSKTAEILLQTIRARCPHATVIWAFGWFHKRAFFPRLVELCEQYDVECADLRDLRFKANEAVSGMTYESMDGTQKVVSDTCITHPGDSGMKAIADRIVSVLKETALLP